MHPVFEQARAAPARIVYAEGEDERVLRAAQILVDEGVAHPILLGRRHVIEARVRDMGLRMDLARQVRVIDPNADTGVCEPLVAEYQRLVGRRGTPPDAAARLGAFVGCYFLSSTCQRKKVAVWFAFWGEVKARPQYQEVCATYDRLHDETLEGLCVALIADGGYGDLSARDVARLVASMCHGLWLELLTGRERLGRPELARLAADGLAALFPRHAALLSRQILGEAA